MKLLKNFLNHFLIDIKLYWKHQWELSLIFFPLLCYKCHKTNPNRGGSYIDSPGWIKNKKAIINPINKKDYKCFQYVTVALNLEELKKIHKEWQKLSLL